MNEITRRPITAHIFRVHAKHRLRVEWQSFVKWSAAFPECRALYKGNRFVCVR